MYPAIWGYNKNDVAAPWPAVDGTPTPITWDTNSSGFRSVRAAEGTETTKYLLEISATSNTQNVARTIKLYTFDIKTNQLNSLFSINGTSITGFPGNVGYDCFRVNVQGGFFVFESYTTFYVCSLSTGAIIGTYALQNEGGSGLQNVIFGIDDRNIYLYYSYAPYMKFVTGVVNTTNGTVSWGTAINVNTSNQANLCLGILKDTRAGAPANRYIVDIVTTLSTNYYKTLHYLDISTGVDTTWLGGRQAPNSTADWAGVWISGDLVLGYGYNFPNMQWAEVYDESGLVTYKTSGWISWGTCANKGKYPVTKIVEKNYYILIDNNQDVWLCKTNPGNGLFGTAKFRASNVIPGLTSVPSGGNILNQKPIIPTSRGFFYCGFISNTTKVAPVIWYYLA